MADPSGQIIDLPIKSNFREGLTMLEYFISTHGARKGLADTALRTAESGYLTRRLIDVGQDVIVYDEDCHTEQGILIATDEAQKMRPDDLRRRITGRWLADRCVDEQTGEVIAERNAEITEALAATLVETLVSGRALGVRVRSVLTCMSKRGVCRLCYGWSMASHRLVMRGEAVGIIAAESIGEPGTQLTMRTFHTGGVAGEDITQGLPRVEELFEARVPKERAVISEIDGVVDVQRGDAETHIFVTAAHSFTEPYVVPPGYTTAVEDGAQVAAGAILAEPVPSADGRSDGDKLTARKAGRVSVQPGRLLITYEDVDRRDYTVPNTARIIVEGGQTVNAGDMLTEGSKNPEDVLNVLGPQAVQKYLTDEVQRVYRSQGVSIDDKHIEVVVRQMLRKVRVETPGDTELLPGELIDRFTIDEVNRAVLAQDGEPATAKTVLLGVTKASLNTDSFLAAASFQETTRVLTDAAISGKKDRLQGLKENVIIGKLIPAGSGLFARTRRAEPAPALLGSSRDTVALEEGPIDSDAAAFAEEEAGRANALLGAGDDVGFDLGELSQDEE
jgi:DNA-directed RNA polymerase subunit beta'